MYATTRPRPSDAGLTASHQLCACGAQIEKPKRGPWSKRCTDCKRALDSARKRGPLASLTRAEAEQAWASLSILERHSLAEELGLPLGEELFAAIVLGRLPEVIS